MVTTYALWDLETGNLVGAYACEADALAVVRRSIEEHGRASVGPLALARETQRSTKNVAQGDELAARALAGARSSGDVEPASAVAAAAPDSLRPISA
jgi:hypothetical protein